MKQIQMLSDTVSPNPIQHDTPSLPRVVYQYASISDELILLTISLSNQVEQPRELSMFNLLWKVLEEVLELLLLLLP